MADIRYVDIAYTEDGYWVVGSTNAYIEPEYFVDGYVITGTTHSGEAAISAAFVMTSTPARTRTGVGSIASSAQISATVLRIKPNSSSLTSNIVISSDADRIANASSQTNSTLALTSATDRIRYVGAVLSSQITLTADTDRTASAQSTLNSQSTLFARGGYAKTANVDMLAFNTVLNAGARIRSDGSDMVASITMTSAADRIRNVATNNNLKTINPTPYTGIYVDRTDHYAVLDDEEYYIPNYGLPFINGADDSEWINDAVISFWAVCDDYTGGTIFSTEGRDIGLENVFTLQLSPTQISLGSGYSAGSAGSSAYTASLSGLNILPGEYHHYFIEINHDVMGSPSPYTAKIWVDGNLILDEAGDWNPYTNFLAAVNPIAIGIRRNRVPEPGNLTINQILLRERFKGTILQLWIGDNVASGTNADTIDEFYDANNPAGPFIDFGITGRKSNNSLQQPVWYEQFDYPFTNDVIGISLTSSSLQMSYSQFYADIWDFYSEAIDTDYLPTTTNQPIVGRFRLTTSGDNIRFGDTVLAAVSTMTVTGNYAKFGEAQLASQTILTVDAYDFTKASAQLNTAATLTLNPGNALRNATVTIDTALTSTITAKPTLAGVTDLTSSFTLTADATTNQLGIIQAEANFTLAAQSYEFTKAQAAFTATIIIEADGRLQDRERGTLLSGMEFALTAAPNRIRPGANQLNSALNLNIQPGNALRRGTVAMSAFAFALTAGRLVDFQTENFINPSQESGILQVWAESTLLLVEAYNGLNTVLVSDGLEDTVLAVDEETTVLLSQFNTPNN